MYIYHFSWSLWLNLIYLLNKPASFTIELYSKFIWRLNDFKDSKEHVSQMKLVTQQKQTKICFAEEIRQIHTYILHRNELWENWHVFHIKSKKVSIKLSLYSFLNFTKDTFISSKSILSCTGNYSEEMVNMWTNINMLINVHRSVT